MISINCYNRAALPRYEGCSGLLLPVSSGRALGRGNKNFSGFLSVDRFLRPCHGNWVTLDLAWHDRDQPARRGSLFVDQNSATESSFGSVTSASR